MSNAGAGGGTALTQATLAVVITPATPPPASASGPANLALLIASPSSFRRPATAWSWPGRCPGPGPGSAIELISGSTASR